MGRSTADLASASNVTSLLGNRQVGPGLYETVLIQIEQLTALLSPAAVRAVFATKAEMDNTLGYPANAGAEVHGDAQAANGIYRKIGAAGGGSWTKVSDLTSAALVNQITELKAALTAQAEDITSLSSELHEAFAGALSQVVALADTSRPGDAPHCFTAQLDGPASGALPITLARSLSAYGPAVRMVGAGKIATRGPQYVEDTPCRVRFVFSRVQDTDDPANDAVRLAVRWLNADQTGLETTVIADLLDITESAGRLHYSFVIGRSEVDGIDVVAPAGSVYARPFLQCFGGGETEIEVLEWASLADAVDWSPDVTAFERTVSGLSNRLEALGESFTDLGIAVAGMVQRSEQSSFQKVVLDADFSVAASDEVKTILHTATLSQPRSLTLVRQGARAGSRIAVTRSGAGTFDLNVRDGATLKQLSTNTWCDFVFDGEAWQPRASGTL